MNAYDAALSSLAEDIRLVDGNHDLGAGELAEALIRAGWTKIEYITRFPVDYTTGRHVEILDGTRGTWLEGTVSGHVGNTVQVDTEFGPKTAGSIRTIRPIY